MHIEDIIIYLFSHQNLVPRPIYLYESLRLDYQMQFVKLFHNINIDADHDLEPV